MNGPLLLALVFLAHSSFAHGQHDEAWSEIARSGNRAAWDSLREHATGSEDAQLTPWHQWTLPLEQREPWAQINDSAAWELAQWVAPAWDFNRQNMPGTERDVRFAELSPEPAPGPGWWFLGGLTLLIWLIGLGGGWWWVRSQPKHLPRGLAPLFQEHTGATISENDRLLAMKRARQLLGLQSLVENRALRFKSRLTPAEIEVVELLMAGTPVNEMARQLACSKPHIYNVRSSIRKKLDLPSTGDLVDQLNALVLKESGATSGDDDGVSR